MLTDISPVGRSTDQAAPNSAQESYYVNSALTGTDNLLHMVKVIGYFFIGKYLDTSFNFLMIRQV